MPRVIPPSRIKPSPFVTRYKFADPDREVEKLLEEGWKPVPHVLPVTYYRATWTSPLTGVFLQRVERKDAQA